ncbi:MAG: GNAT family N-acetyltransferase [Planctomycetaceae bacterium]|nr:GNAT family N-acetyltransferase [Planctomycetaceae bacterium]
MPPPELSVTLRLATDDDRSALCQWMRAHLEGLAVWNPTVGVDAPFDEQWLERPDVLFPWLIEVAGTPAGFAFLGNHRLAAAMGASSDFYFHEFHVDRAFRRRGVGRRAVELLLERHVGSWTLDVLPSNGPAVAFWESALGGRRLRRTPRTGEDGVQFVRFVTEG